MGNITLSKKVVSVVVSAATIIALSGLMPLAAHAQALDLQAQINALLAQIAQLQAQLKASSAAPAAAGYAYSRNLTVGSRGDDVTALQQMLYDGGYLAVNPTGYFGNLTKAALGKYQAAKGISPAVGYFGPITRAAVAAAAPAAPVAAAPAAPVVPGAPAAPAGSGLAVSATLVPAGALLPQGAASVPFLTLMLTAGATDVKVSAMNVERVGAAQNTFTTGVGMLDADGIRQGTFVTLGSDNKARVVTSVTVKAGQSTKITLAADMAAALVLNAGEQPALRVNSLEVDGNVPVTGLPVTSNTMTVNATLAIGTVTLTAGPANPAAATRELGTTSGFTFTSVRIAVNSAEEVNLTSVKWNQSGSAAAADIANIVTVLDGVSYPTTASADGKYYTSVLNKKMAKGSSMEMYVKGDVVSGSGRTVKFDLYRYADLQARGLTFGYDTTPTAVATCGAAFCFQAANPNVNAVTTTIGSGSMQVSKGSAVPSQILTNTTPRQIIAAMDIEVKGEEIQVAGPILFNLQAPVGTAVAAGISATNVTDVALYDANGLAVSTSANAVAGANGALGTVSINSMRFAKGKQTYSLKGTLANFANGATLAASTTVAGWGSVTGALTGNTIVPVGGIVTGNAGTFRSAAIVVSISTQPPAQTIVAGAQALVLSQLVLDATNSGEPVGVTTIPVTTTLGVAATGTDLTNCVLWDGATALTSGANVLNPAAAAGTNTFTLDNRLTLASGVAKTLAISCNLAGNAAAARTYQIGMTAANIAAIGATAMNSGTAVVPTGTAAAGNLMTASAGGTLAVTLDTLSPIAAVFAAGSTNVSVATLRFTSTVEAIDVRRLALFLSLGLASSTPANIVKATLWDGATKVGEAVFPGTAVDATSTITNFMVAKDNYKLMTVKIDSALVGTGQAATAGQQIAVDYRTDNSVTTYGVGQASGSNLFVASASTASAGQIIQRSYPVLTVLPLPTTALSNGAKVLARMKVTANATGDVSLNTLTMTFATTTAGITSLNIYAYNDANFSQPSLTGNADGAYLAANRTDLGAIGSQNEFVPANGILQIPAGGSRYLELRGTVSASAAGASVQVNLIGDTATYPRPAGTFMSQAATVNANVSVADQDNLVWSPNSTTTPVLATNDWTNGFGLGLPTSLQIGFLSQ